MANYMLSILQIVLLAQVTRACIIKAKQYSAKELKFPGPWNDQSNQRTVGSCECGKNVAGKVPPWNMYIHISTDNKTVICSGTIITSNLIATSHECLRRSGKKLHGYDAWNISPDHKGFVKLNEIKVTSSADVSSGESFHVLELIPNPQYLVSWVTRSERAGYNSLDLLLLKVKADFTNHKEHSPICIPEDSINPDFVRQTGYYYSADEASLNATHEGGIFTQKMCENGQLSTEGGEGDKLSGICLRWTSQAGPLPPRNTGGPLFLQSTSQNAFLLGVACNVTTKLGEAWIDNAYFSNIFLMIKYVEYRADQHNSSWCKTPALKLAAKHRSSNEPFSELPWEKESIQQTFRVRNESLDCVCGVPNYELSGRIAGGVNATPFEFGWMVGLRLGKNGGGFCGGSIINNRMILTASHCLVSRGGSVTKPEDVVVNINMHFKKGDKNTVAREVQSVIVHPNYIQANKEGVYDYDIALLVLKDELKFLPLPEEPPKVATPNLRPICLPKMGETISLAGEQVMVSGWGYIDDVNRISPDRLQKIDLPIIPLQDCRSIAASKVTERFLCAGSLNRSKDAARGDSGGPLSIMRGRQWTEVGIVSWGEDKEENRKYIGTAALYTDVTNPAILPIVDYFAVRTGAQWCKSEIS